MAGLLFFFPGRPTSLDAPKLFADYGCPELLDAEDAMPLVSQMPVVAGPTGEPGILVAWDDPAALPIAYQPDVQTWAAAAKSGDLPAGRYWVGLRKDYPPTSVELQRTRIRVGISIKLGRDVWTVPVARDLPQVMGFDADGKLAMEFDDDRFRRYFDETAAAFKGLQTGNSGGEFAFSLEQQFRFCAFALGFNYRVNADVLKLIRAIRSDLCWGAAYAASGAPDMEDVAKKRLAEAATEAGASA